jgi:3-oxoadipate CoA-transferase, beta subunit
VSVAVTGFGGSGFLSQAQMAALVARDIPAGSYVNLGIGLPTTVADYLPPESGVVLHTENGMLGMGPLARGDDIDPDLINAGKVPVTELPGAAYFDQAQSFGMIRGGHIGVCVLGAFQVSVSGDLANWSTAEPGAIPAVGGAMDLASGAREVFVMMSLLAKDGRLKIVPECTYPLTGVRCVTRVYTERAVILVTGDGLAVRDVFGTSVSELRELLNLPLVTAG